MFFKNVNNNKSNGKKNNNSYTKEQIKTAFRQDNKSRSKQILSGSVCTEDDVCQTFPSAAGLRYKFCLNSPPCVYSQTVRIVEKGMEQFKVLSHERWKKYDKVLR